MIDDIAKIAKGLSDWPEGSRFQYGDPVHVPPKYAGGASFSGFVVGWYRPLHGRWLGYAVQNDRDNHVHVEPSSRLVARAGPWTLKESRND